MRIDRGGQQRVGEMAHAESSLGGAEDRHRPLPEKTLTTANSFRRVDHLSSDLLEFQACVHQMCVCSESPVGIVCFDVE